MPKQIAIYGAGGFAREVQWLLSALPEYKVVGYIEDGAESRMLHGIPVRNWNAFSSEHPGVLVAIGIGDPEARRKIARQCEAAGYASPILVHPSVYKPDRTVLGPGTIVCCGSIATVDIQIGRHVHVNLDCTIGHDVRIGDYTTLAPGVHVSGNVHIGESVYVGTGANIINGNPGKPLVIADGCVIGAGACVTASTEPRALYAGVPATLKKRYS